MTPLYYFLIGLGAFVSAIVGAVVLLRKMGPEISHIQVESAQSLVNMANTQADRLAKANKDLDDRLTRYVADQGRLLARIEELELKAQEVPRLISEVKRLQERLEVVTAEKEAALLEAASLRARVAHLETEIRRLDSQH